ncbi:hypothetical protein HQ533_05120 [Candidatus Woesearchaeota archaeon]|nr:hypothetical protein [Candidatus Woesearchaeota archaeon]
MNKKGFELATNMLVVIILSIALITIGFGLFSKFIDTGKKLQASMTDKMEQDLDKLMDDGSLIVIPRTTIKAERGKAAIFTVGFWNELNTVADFRVKVESKSTNFTSNDIIYFTEDYSLQPNQKQHALIQINIPKKTSKGQHAFDVEIIYKYTSGGGVVFENTYDSKKRIYVIV